jgi:hypothetical protein
MSESEKEIYTKLVDALPDMSSKAFHENLPTMRAMSSSDVADCDTLYRQLQEHVKKVKDDARKAIDEHVDRQKRKFGDYDGPGKSVEDEPIVDGMSAKELIAKMTERTDELAQANEDAAAQIASLEKEVESRLKALARANKRVGVVAEERAVSKINAAIDA